MPLIRDNRVIERDDWLRLDDDARLPEGDAKVIVSLNRWQAERATLLAHNAPVGVVLAAGDEVAAIAADIDRLSLVALIFPKFADGRAYSAARILRGRYRFKGELRAVGNVLRDQLMFMQRCGFNACELQKGDPAEAWKKALGEFSVWYQKAADGRASAAERRAPFHAPRRAIGSAARPAPALSAGAGDWAY
jgi:uncharacterized protein (DUF934 family)